MKTVIHLTRRNVKLFFKDKAMFFTSLITPLILLVLYTTFLSNVYKDSFMAAIPSGITIDDALIDGLVGGQLVSSLLAVSCITVSFCSNFLMVQDKANGAYKDLTMSALAPSQLAISYYAATLISTFAVCYTATALSFAFLAFKGWYLSIADALMFMIDVFVLVLFGTALSSIVSFFMTTQGQISAVGSIVSSVYGFICGAYMPISSFSSGLRKIVSFLPGTHGTSLLRNHAMRGVLSKMESDGVPSELITGLKDSVDCNIYCFDKIVPTSAMLLILCGSVIVCLSIYVTLNITKKTARSS